MPCPPPPLIILLLFMVLPSLTLAEPYEPLSEAASLRQKYHACIIQYVQSARSGVAASHLQKACQHRYANKDGYAAAVKHKAYDAGVYDLQQSDAVDFVVFYDCLFNHLPKVTNDHSAGAMYQLCKDQYYPTSALTKPQKKKNIILQFLGIGHKKSQNNATDMSMDGDAFVPLNPWTGGR